MKILLDTHAWVWWHSKPAELGDGPVAIVTKAMREENLLLSAISTLEVAMLVQKGRLDFTCTLEDWMTEALRMPGLRLVPLTPEIAIRSTRLSGVFHKDPADRIIVATALEEGAAILTKDKLIRGYKPVKSVW